MKQCLVTGASGFIGRSVCRRLAADFEVVTVGRSPRPHKRHAVVPDLASFPEWPSLLGGIDVVVHCAGCAHVKGAGDEALALHRAVNVEGTRRLAECAAQVGVKRFVFISSIGVNGNRSLQPFTEQDVESPQEPYAVSKREAEQVLWQIHEANPGMEVVVIRPPLVYGPAAPGNFGSLVHAIKRSLPLPLGAVHNKRTLIALDNLADLVACCAFHPKAANQLFLAGDGADISTTSLLRKMGEASGKRAKLIPVPVSFLRGMAGLFGRRATVDKLCADLQVDTSKARQLLGWSAPLTVDQGLERVFAPDVVSQSEVNREVGAVDSAGYSMGAGVSAGGHAASIFSGNDGAAVGQKVYASRRGMMLRALDVVFAAFGLVVAAPILLLIYLAGLLDTGAPLFRQERVGQYRRPFVLVKFRTMRLGTASVASHLADGSAITPLGRFLRRTKLDELPQLWNVLKGDMSLVGPRPGLVNQLELLQARQQHGVLSARPGITGLAQVSGIDMSTPELLAKTDAEMLAGLTVGRYFRYLFQTVSGGGRGDAAVKGR